jgi:hypothetical protein
MAWCHEIWNEFYIHQPVIDLDWSTLRDKTHGYEGL